MHGMPIVVKHNYPLTAAIFLYQNLQMIFRDFSVIIIYDFDHALLSSNMKIVLFDID